MLAETRIPAGAGRRALDEPGLMVIELEFTDVGSYRRAMGSSDVKMRAVEFLSGAIDEPSAFEVLHDRTEDAVTGFGELVGSRSRHLFTRRLKLPLFSSFH